MHSFHAPPLKLSLLLGLFLTLAANGLPQTCSNLIRAGRIHVIDGQFLAAQASFAAALTMCPQDPEANATYALTRLLTLPLEPATSNFLARLGLPFTERSYFQWTNSPPVDEEGVLLAPEGMNASEGMAVVRTQVLPGLLEVESRLAQITDTNFLLQLSRYETRSADVTLDYGDLLLIRAALQGAVFVGYTLNSYNYDIRLSEIRSLFTDGGQTIQGALRAHPAVLGLIPEHDLKAARAAFLHAVDLYLQAAEWIRTRPGYRVRLFNYESDLAREEQEFRQTLLEARSSLDQIIQLTIQSNLSIHAAPLFAGNVPVRDLLPAWSGNHLVLSSFPDTTFGGTVFGLGETELLALEEAAMGGGVPVPRIGSLSGGSQAPGGPVRLTFRVQPEHGYVVLQSANLVDWRECYVFVATAPQLEFSSGIAAAEPQGFFRLEDRTAQMPAPFNSQFSNALPLIAFPATGVGYVRGSRLDGEPTGEEIEYAWWVWTAPTNARVRVSDVSGRHATFGTVFSGNTPEDLSEEGQWEPWSGSGEGWPPGCAFTAVAGRDYFIRVRVDEWLPRTRTVPIQLALAETSEPPQVQITAWSGSGTVAFAPFLLEGQASDTDGTVERIEIWLDRNRLVSLAGGTFRYFLTNAGPGYHWVQVRAYDNTGMFGQIEDTFYCRPVNDDFTNRIHLRGLPASAPGYPQYATAEPDEPAHYQGQNECIWYSWVAPVSGSVVARVQWDEGRGGSALGVDVYAGDQLLNLASVASGPLTVPFQAERGQTYSLAVSTWSASPVTVSLQPCTVPENDRWDRRAKLAGTALMTFADLCGARPNADSPDQELWWAWTSPSDGPVTVSTAGSDFDTRLDVWAAPAPDEGFLVLHDDDSGVGRTSLGRFWAEAGTVYHVRVTGKNHDCGKVALSLNFTPEVTLAAATDQPWFAWRTEGEALWTGTRGISHDGQDAAESGRIGNGEQSRLQVGYLDWEFAQIEQPIYGPAVLSFWWKVSSELGWDYLEFYVDGELQNDRISGEQDWQRVDVYLPEGEHYVEWRYAKDESVSEGHDRGWVDEVTYTPLDE